MPGRLQGVFQSTRLNLAGMFNEECRRGSNHNSHSGIRSDLRGATERTNLWNVGIPLLTRRGLPDVAFENSGPGAR